MPREFFSSNTPQQLAASAGQIFEARNDAREQVAQQFDTVEDPSRVGIGRRDDGFGPRDSFLDRALPREAAHDLNPEFPRQDLGPADVRETEQGFAPTEGVRRQSAAFQFEEQTPLEDVDPREDITQREDGAFGLAPQAQQTVAAERLDDEFPGQDLGPGDVMQAPDGEGFIPTEGTRRRSAERQLEEQVPIDLDPFGDLRALDGGGFGLDQQAERAVAAERLSEDVGRDVAPSDLQRDGDQFLLPR